MNNFLTQKLNFLNFIYINNIVQNQKEIVFIDILKQKDL